MQVNTVLCSPSYNHDCSQKSPLLDPVLSLHKHVHTLITYSLKTSSFIYHLSYDSQSMYSKLDTYFLYSHIQEAYITYSIFHDVHIQNLTHTE